MKLFDFPKLNPSLSGPLRKMGARKASAKKMISQRSLYKSPNVAYRALIDCAIQGKCDNPTGKPVKSKTLSIRKREKERGICPCPKLHSIQKLRKLKTPFRIKYFGMPYRYFPELDEVGQRSKCNKDTVDECIAQEKDEKFVVCESNTIVDPRAVVIHFCNTHTTDTAMVTPVRLDMDTLFTVPC